MIRTHDLVTAVLAVVTLAPVAAAAEPELAAAPPSRLPVAISLDLETSWRLDQGYRLLSSSRTASKTGVTLSYDVTRATDAPRLALGLGYHGESSTGEWANGNGVGLDVASGSLSAALRWPILSWLEPQLRVAADLARARLSIENRESTLVDSTWSAGASAGAGIRLRTGTARIGGLSGGHLFALAGIIEGGFHVGQPLSFAARGQPTASGAPDDRISAAPVVLGSLGRSYPYLRVSVALVF
jgi:hypothetical protein